MVDFRAKRQIPTQQIIDTYGRDPLTEGISSVIGGVEKGMDFSEKVRALKEKKQRAKAIAQMMISPEMEQLVQESRIPREMIKGNEAVFIQSLLNSRNKKTELTGEDKYKEAEELAYRQNKGRTRDEQPIVYVDPINNITKDARGNILESVPKGAKVIRTTVDPQVKSDIAEAAAVKKDKDIRDQKLKNLGQTVLFFEQAIKKIPVSEGMKGRLEGIKQKGLGALQLGEKGENVAIYESNVNGMRSQVAKGLGEVGNLTDQEQKYAIGLLPKITDNAGVRRKKIQSFKDYIYMKTGGDLNDVVQQPTDDPLGLLK